MRKLLSLLAISGVAGAGSINVVSCGKSAADKAKDLIDEIMKDFESDNNYESIYNNIRQQLADFAGSDVTASDIANDTTNLFIAIYDANNTPITDMDNITTGDYIIKIEVKDGNQWFEATDGYITKTVHISVSKPDLNHFIYNSDIIGNSWTTKDLYDSVRYQLSNYTRNVASYGDIKDSNDVGISIFKGQDMVVENDTTKISSGDYNLHISATDQQTWFIPTTEYVNIAFTIKPDLTNQTFNKAAPGISTGSALYDNIRTQIASWAGTYEGKTVTADDIKNSDMKINVYLEDGTTPVNDNSDPINPGTYKVTIDATGTQPWFLRDIAEELPIIVEN